MQDTTNTEEENRECIVCKDKDCPYSMDSGRTWLCRKHFYELQGN